MQCRDFREIADSYLSDELLVETNHEVFSHLEACADCRRELAARREVRSRLREAFANAPGLGIGKEFAARLHAQLRATALNESQALAFGRGAWLAAIAACLVVAATFGLMAIQRQQQAAALSAKTAEAQRENTRETGTRQAQSPPDARVAVNTVMAGMSRIATGDHRNCAVEHRLAEAPISLEEAGQRYDRAYINLARAVTSRLEQASELEFIGAHACIFEGRRFGHVVLKRHGRLVSLLVTDLERPAALAGQATAEPNPQRQIISCSEAEGYQVSCFETARHAVFIVSDLSESENLAVARALAPSISEHIARAEGLA